MSLSRQFKQGFSSYFANFFGTIFDDFSFKLQNTYYKILCHKFVQKVEKLPYSNCCKTHIAFPKKLR